MKDVHIARVAGAQFNRISRQQLLALGLSEDAIAHRVASGRLQVVEQAVFAVAPVLDHDEWGLWMGATLTAPGTVLSHTSAAAAAGFWTWGRDHETVTRRGNGGPRRHGGLLVFRSRELRDDDVTEVRGIPVTSPPRTLLDLAAHVGRRPLARSLREAVRLGTTTTQDIADVLGRHRGRRGSARLAAALQRYTGLPLERARSGAEVRALEILRDAGRVMPRLNVRIAGEEADLSWTAQRLIVEVDGGPFHQDRGEDARKEARWRAAGWTVRRISSDDVYEHPSRLLALTVNVPHHAL